MNSEKGLPIAREIKKEYLKGHLDKVVTLVEKWISELRAPILFSKDQLRGWQEQYSPATEEDSDNNHMLKRHLKSRRLWSHHADWERRLEFTFSLVNLVQTYADDIIAKRLSELKIGHTEDYINTALWQGFEIAIGRKSKLPYKMSDTGKGVIVGGFNIETEATTSEEVALVKEGHRKLCDEVSELGYMTRLASEWSEVISLQESMKMLANKALKSMDIFYPCRFCRHLWR